MPSEKKFCGNENLCLGQRQLHCLDCDAPACSLLTTDSPGTGVDLNTTSNCSRERGGGGGTNPAHGGTCTSRLPKCRTIHFHPLSHPV